ncbi:MAG: hypothetical protein QOC63_2715, partial [Mycobacterium sp.]|nr:hypothetical protein [Mycobacterium sp.]
DDFTLYDQWLATQARLDGILA